MPGDPIFEDEKPTLTARLGRLLAAKRASGAPRIAHRRERLDLLVPNAKADAVRAAVAQWLEAQGVSAGLTVEDAGNDRSRIRANLDEAQSAHIDLSADSVQAELETLLADAMS